MWPEIHRMTDETDIRTSEERWQELACFGFQQFILLNLQVLHSVVGKKLRARKQQEVQGGFGPLVQESQLLGPVQGELTSPTCGVRGHEKAVWLPTPGGSSLQSVHPTGREVWDVSAVCVWFIGPNKSHPSLPPPTSLPGERRMVQMTSPGPRTQWKVKILGWGEDSSQHYVPTMLAWNSLFSYWTNP